MALTSQAIVDALASHAAGTGHFERVNEHEATSAPGSGLTAALWPQTIRPIPAVSGLAVTSARLVFTLRIYSPALQQPQDAIDPAVLAAADALMTAYSGDFELGGLVMEIDLLGTGGEPLSATAGWLRLNDGGTYRVMDITIPVIVANVWTQSA